MTYKYGLTQSVRFDRDLTRAVKRGLDVKELDTIVRKLRNDEPLDPKYKDHPLKGKYKGHREYHINSDWLLVYKKLTQKNLCFILYGQERTAICFEVIMSCIFFGICCVHVGSMIITLNINPLVRSKTEGIFVISVTSDCLQCPSQLCGDLHLQVQAEYSHSASPFESRSQIAVPHIQLPIQVRTSQVPLSRP